MASLNEDETIELKDYPLIDMDIEQIQIDKSNPNIMKLEQERGLEKSMMEFGRLKYIVVDQNNILIDGEHRLKVEQAIGTKRIKVIQVNVKDEIERKMMRETLNKLHGEYDKEKESKELMMIYENNRIDDLALLLGQPKDDLLFLMNAYNKTDVLLDDNDKNELDNEEFGINKEISSPLSTSNSCPKCGYSW